MTALTIILATIIALLLTTAAYSFHFISEKLGYRAQHRQGPNRSSRAGWGQQLLDLGKLWSKESSNTKRRGLFFYIGVILYCLLPYAFFVLLLNPTSTEAGGYGGFFSLFLIVAFATALDSLFLFSFKDTQIRILAKRNLLLRYMGLTTLLLSCIPSLIHFGPNIVQGYQDGSSTDYFMFRNPFAFVAGICAFASFYFILPTRPIGRSLDFAFSGVFHFSYRAAKDLWIVALFSLWVGIFLGGWVGVGVSSFELLFYVVKLSIVLIAFVWVQKVLPSLRVRDSIDFGLKRLLPLACIATIGEILWVAILG